MEQDLTISIEVKAKQTKKQILSKKKWIRLSSFQCSKIEYKIDEIDFQSLKMQKMVSLGFYRILMDS